MPFKYPLAVMVFMMMADENIEWFVLVSVLDKKRHGTIFCKRIHPEIKNQISRLRRNKETVMPYIPNLHNTRFMTFSILINDLTRGLFLLNHSIS